MIAVVVRAFGSDELAGKLELGMLGSHAAAADAADMCRLASAQGAG